MGKADHLELGQWNATCYQCGFKRKSGQLEKNWQGFYVCPEHNEPRQAQDFARAVPDNQIPPWVQSKMAATYTYTNFRIGQGDGVTNFFQLGCGLYPITITSVTVAGVSAPHTNNLTGGITITTIPPVGAQVLASGTEVVP